MVIEEGKENQRETKTKAQGVEFGPKACRPGSLCSSTAVRIRTPERCERDAGRRRRPPPVLDIPHGSRLGRGLRHVIDLAFVFLFKFGKAQARRPPLCAMPRRHALCRRCHTRHRPRLQPPVPCRGSGKSCLFLFYNITWFCKCCFLFRYLYFLLLKVR